MPEIIQLDIPPDYQYTSPDLSNLRDTPRFRGTGESLGERFARQQAAANRPVDLSGLRNLAPSTNQNTPRPANAPATPRVPMSVPASSLLNAGSRALNAGSTYTLGASLDDMVTRGAEQGINALPPSIQPIADGVYDGLRRLQNDASPILEAHRTLGDIPRVLNGEPPRSNLGELGQPLVCSILGVGCSDSTPDGQPTNGLEPALPPFQGGQSPGVMYRVDLIGIAEDYQGNELIWRNGNSWNIPAYAPGVISGVAWMVQGDWLNLVLSHGNGQAVIGGAAYNVPSDLKPKPKSAQILSITRTDGQPDTGGNPPAIGERQPARPSQRGLVSPPNVYPTQQPGTNPGSPAPESLPSNPPSPAIQPPVTQPPTPTPESPNPEIPTPPSSTPPVTPESPNSPIAPTTPNQPINPLIPLGIGAGAGALGGILAPTVLSRARSSLSGATNPQLQTSGSTRITTPTDTPTGTCRFHEDTVSHEKLDLQYAVMQAMEAFQTQMLTRIDDKLGAQIPNGGLSGFIKKFFDIQIFDRILNILTFVTALHNAQMLSNSIKESLFASFDNVLETFKLKLTDSEGNETDTSSWVGDQVDSFFKSLFGDTTVEEVKAFWRRVNRIYQAATNIVYSLQSIMDSTTNALETIANYSGKIGNALKRYGVVAERAYGWMNPQHDFHRGKFWNFLNNTEEAAEAIENITSEVLNITQEAAEIRTQSNEFRQAVSEVEQQIGELELESKLDSNSPVIQPNDLVRPEE